MTETVDTHDAPDQPVEEVTVEEPSQQSTTATTTGVDVVGDSTTTATTTTTSSLSPALNCMFAFLDHCECCSVLSTTHPFDNDI